MSVKGRIETLEGRAGGAGDNPRVFIMKAEPDAECPDVCNLDCEGVERPGVREGDISAEAEKLAESLGGYKELSDVIMIQQVLEGYKTRGKLNERKGKGR